MTSDSTVLNGSYKTEGFKLEGVLGTTKAEGGTSFTANYGDFAALWNGSINSTGKRIELNPANPNVTGLPSNYDSGGGSWAIVRQPNSDKENFAQADATMDLDWGSIQSFKTGARVAKHTFTKQADRPLLGTFGTIPFGSIYSGSEPLGFELNAPKANLGAMVADATSYIKGWVADRSAYGELNEDNKAVYGMFNFERGPLRGNFGLRYISTDVSASGYQFDSNVVNQSIGQNNGWSTGLTTKTSNYTDVLPSANVVFDLDQKTVLRVAAAQAVTRPNYGDMFLGGSVQGFNDTISGNEAITLGNPALKPQKSTQFDLGLEYYYGKGNLVAVTYFHKDIDNFVTSQTQRNQKIGLVSPDSKVDNWTVNTVVNAGGGKIDGLEFQINHGFDNGFGVNANYTYTDATAPSASYADELNLFTGSSRNTANLVGYWEDSVYSARLAYNWRSEYMIRETGFYSNRKHDAFGTLDLSLGWNITKDLKLAFEALNLLKADDIQFGAAAANNTKLAAELRTGFPAWSFKGETTYRASLTAKF
jgi:iron complex outermembrane receptor protein